MIRAVIDTNVLVSALISPSGNEALIVLAISQGLLTPCVSRETLEEYAEVLARPKFSFRQDEIRSLLQLLDSNGENTVPEPLPLNLTFPTRRIESFWLVLRLRQPISLLRGTSDIFHKTYVVRSRFSMHPSFSIE